MLQVIIIITVYIIQFHGLLVYNLWQRTILNFPGIPKLLKIVMPQNTLGILEEKKEEKNEGKEGRKEGQEVHVEGREE